MRFVDECHHGGTTPLAKTTLKYYGGNVFTVYCTATYCKPIYKLNIPEECRSLWDMECIKLCKNINIPKNKERLIKKVGEEFREIISQYSDENIMEQYNEFPEMAVFTDNLLESSIEKICNRNEILGHEDDGWSLPACFLLNSQRFILNKKNKTKRSIKPTFQAPEKVLD